MQTKERDDARGAIYSNTDLKKLILPLIMEQLLAILVGMLDTVMISGVGEAAGRSAWQMVLFLLYASVITTIVLIGGNKRILRTIFGQVEEDVMRSAATYLIITGFFICPLALYNGCAALFRAMGDSKTTMYISLLMNFMNLVGNAVLIFIFKLGVAGAAISTRFYTKKLMRLTSVCMIGVSIVMILLCRKCFCSIT